MNDEKFFDEDYCDAIVVRKIYDKIHFELYPRDTAILTMALKFAIEKADIYKSEMKCIHDYIIKTALEQQKEKDF